MTKDMVIKQDMTFKPIWVLSGIDPWPNPELVWGSSVSLSPNLSPYLDGLFADAWFRSFFPRGSYGSICRKSGRINPLRSTVRQQPLEENGFPNLLIPEIQTIVITLW